MGLTKNQLASARKIYDSYWLSYTKGDLETFASTLDEDFEMIGTSESEVAHGKAEGIEFYKAQMAEVVGKAEMRNRQISAKPLDDMVLINETCDIYVLAEPEWMFYSKIRISTLLHETNTGWKVIQQHGSLPDMRVSEGETIAFDKITKENLELRDAVKRRTVELENKNRELAIEAALEKVRAVAMGMKKPEDMLDVCHEISDQLQDFGVEKIRNVQTAIIDEHIGQYLCYQYFTPYDKTAVEKTEYLKSPVEHGMVKQMLASRDGYFIGGLSGQELEDFRSHRKEENHFPDPFLDKATELDYCFLSIGEGGLGLTLYQPIADDVLSLFKRFHQVFSLAYQRFRDIQKAEAQAREAQIEVAVEKVRAQSMAMHHPDDLDKVNKEILTQLNWLQIQGLSGVTFYLVDQDGWVKAWDFSSPGNIGNQNSYTLQFDFKKYEMMGYPFRIFQQTDLNYLVAEYPLEKLERAVFEIEEINPEVATIVKEALAKGILTHQWSACARITDGLLGIDLVSPPSEDTKTIVLKIAGAFNQAYQRFLDLQKAEAQAREAQIEVALERTRTQSMLMQHSDEIKSISNVFHEQLLLLGIPSEFSYVWLPDEANQSHQFWASWSQMQDGNDSLYSKQVTYPLDKTEPYTAACYAAWANPDVILEEFIPPSDIAGFFEVWQELLAGATKLKADFFPEGIYYSEAYMRYGCFGINIRRKLSEEEKNILKRFSKEFERAYTRFLDLQKAEAQAREAQIEAALERVRAQTMAMHNSEDVGKCVVKMFAELTALGVDEGTRFGIGILNHENENNQLWTARKDGDDVNMHIGNLDMASHPLLKSARKAWKDQIPFHKYVLEGEDLLDYYRMLNNAPDYKIQIPIEKLPKKEIQHCFIFEHGFFYAFTPKEFQPDLIHITKRFSSLFEQTYRRYLDLVRAETQAREAEIELALERVRARTMAMHHTEELKEVIQVVFDQFVGLNIHVDHAGFILDYKEREDMHIWLADHQQGVPSEITIPYFDSPHWNSFREARAKGDSFFYNLLDFEVKNNFYKDLFELIPELTEEAQQAIFSKPALAISTVLLDNVGLYIEHYSEKSFTSEENAILMRFGIVFQQTYTRFLDLQKAEAQAREAQIENALEKVRSRTMAMQRSDELTDVAGLLFNQVSALGIKTWTAGFNVWSDDNNSYVDYLSLNGEIYGPNTVHTEKAEALKDLRNARKSGVEFDVLYVEGEKIKELYLAISGIDEKEYDIMVKDGLLPSQQYEHFVFGAKVSVMFITYEPVPEAHDIFKRLGKVFEQTYTRFLDLQTAEAQAREATIEAALEKVRSRSLAMHKSDELNEVVAVLFEKLKDLQIPFTAVGIGIPVEGSKDLDGFVCGENEAGLVINSYRLPYFDHQIPKDVYSALENQLDYFVGHYSKEEKDSFYNYLIENTAEFRLMPEDTKRLIFESTSYTVSTVAVKNAVVNINDFEGKVLAESEIDIIKRFARVFDQAYTRFLDLQKAEAQARESQIQLALERVRARTMAMQHSDELMVTSELMFEQIKNLGIELWSCGFSLWYDNDSYFLGYNPGPHGKLGNPLKIPLKIPLTEDIFFTTIREAKRRGDEFLVFESEGESLVETYRYMDGLPVVGETMRGFVEAGFPLPTFQVTHCGFFSNGHLMFITKEPNSEAVDIFKRFTKVFNQTYTRFLDLQKAEEQVREAQIEAALERVRSRSLAMHKTSELQSVIHTVHHELLNLNISISGGSFIVINSEIDNEIQCWGSGGTADTSDKVRIPRFEKPFYTHLLNRIKSGPGFFTEEFTRDEKIEFFTFLFQQLPWSKLGEKEKKETLSAPGGYTRSCAVSRHTSIFIINHFGEKFSESENAILKRFGKVFEQSYTRFLDLQKAESQAREARIEAALERVRSRTMAMQSSVELGDVAAELFAQMNQLVTNLWTCGFVLCEKDRNEDEWWLSMDGDFTRGFFLPNVGDYAHATLYEGWLKGEALRALQLDGETLQQHYDWLMEIPVSRAIFEEMDAAGLARPDWQKLHAAYFSKGYLVLITRELCGEEEIFRRFAQVFDQTYTRFLDLQKAEAQAREAQVNLAVERVRARALAMFKSEEILQVVHKLKDEIMGLDIPNVAAATIHLKERDGMCRVWDLTSLKIEDDGLHLPLDIRFCLEDTHPDFFMRRIWENEADYFVVIQKDSDFKHTLKWLRDNNQSKQADEAEEFFRSTQLKKVYHPTVPLNNGRMNLDLLDTPDPEIESILKKMAGAFDLAYKRFEDLQKAEAQAKEAEIQLALERVRARSLAMHRSEELADISLELVRQVQTLGMESWFCAFNIYDDDPRGSVEWGSNGQGTFPQYRTPREGVFLRYFEAGQRGETLLVNEIGEEACPAHYEYLCSLPGVGEQLLQMKAAGIPFPTSQIDHVAFFKYGYVLFITYEPAHESQDIFRRFAKVFEQSYTRFLDLQKAEAQAREAQIENALEKVRSRTMAMQRSDELTDVAGLLFNQVSALGIKTWTAGFNVWSEDNNSCVDYISVNGEFIDPYTVNTEKTEALKDVSNARKSGVEFVVLYSGGEKIKQLTLATSGIDEKEYDIMLKDGLLPSQQYEHFVFGSKVSVMFLTYEPVPEAHDIFKRLGKVFEQTYTRFLDLQKAEAQAREAKIETALEKVRSRTMGMQSSEELPEVANLLFTEVRALGIYAWSCGYNILAEDKKSATCCMSSEGTLQTPFQLRLWGENSFDEMGEFVLSDHTMLVQELGGTALEEHYAHMKSFPDLKPTFDEIDRLGLSLPTYQINHLCKFTGGFILFITYEKVPESHAIFKRFTNVFDQTYTRFLDLKKAEAQAREAQIENALEKVRSRSLAMQSPDELIEVAQLLREEMGALGVEELETSSIYIHDNDSNTTQCWFTIKNSQNPGKAITDQMTLNLRDTWVGRKMLDFYHSPSNQTSILMQGEQRIEWIRYCEGKSELFGSSNFYGEIIPDRTYHLYKFSNGYIGAAAPGEISSESWELLKRATAVFSFAYTRFGDLQMAEASARTAMRQASLDRVRAEISSMRHADDLDRITPLFFHELTTLGIPFIRCGVFIIQEKQEIVEAYLSSPDGNSLGVLRLPYQASELTYKTVEAWRKGSVYRQHWNKEDFVNWINQLMEQDQIQDSSTYQGTAAPPESLDLHFVPFTQGMLYVGAEKTLDEKELELVQALAKAFSIAYARYQDFVKLEHAKTEVESAMSELKATQSQLVQQEKLASLGQLTAGIAHEIKNPLNFVNNFSEVSIELLNEAIEERSKSQESRDETLVDEILIDIKSNLKKVHEHGSRANGIVTSMLQHSRGGSGKIDPTDLNALVKEYVNLSFHGMRAGKNPINVDIQLDLDQGIKEVSLIKEDFTRVIINLCNNAFDAMRGKTLQGLKGYQPT